MHKPITPALSTFTQDTLIGSDTADKASDAAGLTGKITLCYPKEEPIYPCTLRLKGRATWWRAMLACDGRQGCEEIILTRTELVCDKNAMKAHPTFEVSGGAKFSVLDSYIRGCSSSSSGGFVRAYDKSLVRIRNSIIHASRSSESGGAIALYGSTLTVVESLFSHCSAGSGGAIWGDKFLALPLPAIESSIFITESRFSHCTSSRDGGAIFATGGILKLEFCTFDNNVAEGEAGGGGMCLKDVDAAIMFEVEHRVGQAAQNNTAPAGGGGLILWTGRTPKVSVQCAPGYEGSWSECVPCSIGSYKNASGTHSCMKCPPGSYSTAPASWSFAQCAIGTFSTDLGANSSSTCQSCARDSSTLYVGRCELRWLFQSMCPLHGSCTRAHKHNLQVYQNLLQRLFPRSGRRCSSSAQGWLGIFLPRTGHM